MRFLPLLIFGLVAIDPTSLRGESLQPAAPKSSLQVAEPIDSTRRETMNLTNPKKLEAGPEASLQIELRFLLRIPPSETFNLVAKRLPEWFGAIHSIEWDHTHSKAGPGQVGACSERICNFGGKALREEIISYEEGRRYTYRADMTRSEMKMPLSNHLGSFEIEKAEGGSVVIWRQYFRARWYMPAFMLRWQMRDRMMRPAVAALITKYGGEWLSVR